MTIEEAVALVVADQRKSDPDLTRAEAIEHVLATMSPAEILLSDEPGQLSSAYALVLANPGAAALVTLSSS